MSRLNCFRLGLRGRAALALGAAGLAGSAVEPAKVSTDDSWATTKGLKGQGACRNSPMNNQGFGGHCRCHNDNGGNISRQFRHEHGS
jgi:hypothetical protein